MKQTDKEGFKKEYAWVIEEVGKLINKEQAIELYNSYLNDGLDSFFEKIQKISPQLDSLRKEKLSLVMLDFALRTIGEIKEEEQINLTNEEGGHLKSILEDYLLTFSKKGEHEKAHKEEPCHYCENAKKILEKLKGS